MSVVGIVLTALLAAVSAYVLFKSIVIVRPHERGVVERMGRYNRTLGSGLNLIAPIFERAHLVDMRETLIDVPAQEVITRDNVGVGVDAVIYFQVVDPFKVIYNVARFEIAAVKLAQTNLRNVMGDMTLDEALVSREKINLTLRQILDDATDKWGVRITRVEIQKILPPADITEAMSRQMKAERMKRASILEAEGKRRSDMLRAEGEAKAMLTLADAEKKKRGMIAEAEAKAIQQVYDAIHAGKPTKDLLAIKYLETLEKVADGKSTKIFLPMESSGVLSSMATLGDLFREGGQAQNEKKGEKEGKKE
jgi:regulator of protease activity HflC (stomatin/prohibitin superfamily)